MTDTMSKEAFEKYIRELNDKSDRKLSEEVLVKIPYSECHKVPYSSMADCIINAFTWSVTTEGDDYWADVYNSLDGRGSYTNNSNSVIDNVLIPNEAGGVKADSGKIKPTLLFKSLNEQVQTVLRVLQFGANKYGDDNWKLVEKERYEDALGRHILAYYSGEKCDKDTGESHLAHAICCSLFLLDKE